MSLPNETGGGGFGFGDMYPTDDVNNSTGMDNGSGDGGKPTYELVRDVVIILVAGVGAILGLVVLVYVLSLIADRYCCCFPWFQPVGSMHQIDNGAIAHKAGLFGLTLKERRNILDHLLIGMVRVHSDFLYHARQIACTNCLSPV